MRLPHAAVFSLLLAAPLFPAPLYAQDFDRMPEYKPTQQFTGTITSWGHGYQKKAMKDWEEGFARYQPGVHFDDRLVSSAAAIAGLYSERADIGVLAREITPPEVAAYEKVTKQKMTAIEVETGSLSNPDKIMALGIYVNKANPLAKLDFDQLDAIFSAERKRGEPAVIRTWGELGLTGAWAKAPIVPYTGLAFEAPCYFFSQTVMHGSVLWNPDLKQLEDLEPPGGNTPEVARVYDGYQRIVDAVGADRNAIAISGAGYKNPNAKLIAIAVAPAGPYVLPTPATLIDRTYPLVRPVRFYINAGPKLPANPMVVEFFRYILSRQGQRDLLREGDLLPMPAEAVIAERAKLP